MEWLILQIMGIILFFTVIAFIYWEKPIKLAHITLIIIAALAISISYIKPNGIEVNGAIMSIKLEKNNASVVKR